MINTKPVMETNNTPQQNATESRTLSKKLKNKGLVILENQFENYGWILVKNEEDHIIYTKKYNETEYYEIMIEEKKIYVSSPLKNSVYQYRTGFNNYFDAIDYIENKLYDYEM